MTELWRHNYLILLKLKYCFGGKAEIGVRYKRMNETNYNASCSTRYSSLPKVDDGATGNRTVQ